MMADSCDNLFPVPTLVPYGASDIAQAINRGIKHKRRLTCSTQARARAHARDAAAILESCWTCDALPGEQCIDMRGPEGCYYRFTNRPHRTRGQHHE